VPSENTLFILPGTAYIFFPSSKAKSTVINVPLFSFASTTIIPLAKALIILFLFGKLIGFAVSSIEYSLIKSPLFFTISFARSMFSKGYMLLNPEPNTAIVRFIPPI